MRAVRGTSINGPRNDMPLSGGYTYRGTGRDTRTGDPVVMREWNAAIKAMGANPYPRTRRETDALAAAEIELARRLAR